MKLCPFRSTARFVFAAVLFFVTLSARSAEEYLSPTALVGLKDGKTVFVACSGAGKVLKLDLDSGRVVKSISVPKSPIGMTLSSDETKLWVTCAAPESQVIALDVVSGKIVSKIKTGHTSMSPVLSRDGSRLFVCNRFNNDVSVIDLDTKKELTRIPVQREPIAADLTKDGKYLLVANALSNGRADGTNVAAMVSVIDTGTLKVMKELRLPNGSSSLSDLRVSPDGKYAVVTHILSRYTMPTTQLERGWMNTNAKTIIDLATMEILNTVLLDGVDRGAANPCGIAWSTDGKTLAIAHAGTHEISLFDFPKLIEKLSSLPQDNDKNTATSYETSSRSRNDVPNDLAFLVDLRKRVKLPKSDLGPRALVRIGSKICSANYFSDSLTVIDLQKSPMTAESIPLGPKKSMDLVRKGEFNFNDASICFQGWQSCASCHPGEARVDALNWDLLNDGLGNPKNTKSLLLSHRTPPAMSLGARDSAETAVRSGIKFILFSSQPAQVAESIDAYLKSLGPVPSPALVNGKLSSEAKKGRKVFRKAGCADCHSGKLLTDLASYDVGTRNRSDQATDVFDTPSLVEIWRTAPYLHDGSAATIREVITTHNRENRHGNTSQLSEQELNELCAYLLSL